MFFRQPKILFIAIMTLVIGCLMLFINSANKQESSITNTKVNFSNDIDLYATEIFQIQYDELGNKRLEVDAKTFTQFKSGIQVFSEPIFNLYKTNQESKVSTINWVINADLGTINQSNHLLLEDNVFGIRNSEQKYEFKTDWLNYDFDSNKVNSDANITIWQQNNIATATGYNMNLISNKIDMHLHNNVVFNFLESDDENIQ